MKENNKFAEEQNKIVTNSPIEIPYNKFEFQGPETEKSYTSFYVDGKHKKVTSKHNIAMK